ncbi:MAG: IS701 family transposase [Phycisphaerales bacterium]|nr:IS701 family transposase [Phycisphaerales bacterium]
MTTDQIATLLPKLHEYLLRFRDCFCRRATFEHLETYLAGLISEIPRKSVEPIALAADVPVRTLQEFLSAFEWDHAKARKQLHFMVADHHASEIAIGVIDASSHHKQGSKTPGVQRQWCGEMGKKDNCIVGQHLLYTNNDATNPFGCVLCSDLFLPESWDTDEARRKEAGIPEELHHRTKWKIAIDQVREAIGNGVRFSHLVFDEDYGSVPGFWFDLDELGQRGIGEARSNFLCWATEPHCHSLRAEHSPREVSSLAVHSPAFYNQDWTEVVVKPVTRGESRWKYKATRVQLTNTPKGHNVPTQRRYWLIVAKSLDTDETKYFISNADAQATTYYDAFRYVI